ncbi:MAG: pyridoxamine kinase [Clostridiales bacterium]|nr:pyridoxamine kinase [Clostridiales bacterium]
MQKRALAIHDVSCEGRCSLTVALPVLSACGIHTAALPTALLSTHTGEFTGYSCLDLTEEMRRILGHWSTLPLAFDGLYSGFLGSFEQIRLVGDVLHTYRRKGGLTLVDPVMADHGRLYATYTNEMAGGMGELCALADVIVPNMTEACILLDKPYVEHPGEAEVKNILEALAARYDCGQVIITGVHQGDELGAAGFRAQDGSFTFAGAPRLPQVFYGTGDVFASAMFAAMLLGKATGEAAQIAVDFTHQAMLRTIENGLPLNYGVAFEQAIPGLVRELGLA